MGNVEVSEGTAKLKGHPGEDFDVEYCIVFTTEIRTLRSGLPPVVKTSADVRYVRSLDDRPIPLGEYLLERPEEINRLKNHGFSWSVLSYPL